MSDGLLQLLAVLTALYLVDCVAWVGRGALALRALGSRRLRPALPSQLAGNTRGGAVWAQPLPPLGSLFVAQAWPVALSPEGLCTREPLELERGPRASFVRRAAAWGDVREVAAEGRRLLVDGEPFARCESERGAALLAGLARAVQALPASGRAAAIEGALAVSFDPAAAAELRARFDGASRPLRPACNALFVFLVLAAPAAIARLGFSATWIPLLALLLAALAGIALLFRRAHLALYPGEHAARRSALLLIALSPPQAVRALDLLARPLFAGLQPVAAAALLAPAERAAVARATLVDLRHPRSSADGNGPIGSACERWFREAAGRALAAALAREGLSPDVLLAAPAPEDPRRRAYCPRCGTQSDESAGVCDDCDTAFAPL